MIIVIPGFVVVGLIVLLLLPRDIRAVVGGILVIGAFLLCAGGMFFSAWADAQKSNAPWWFWPAVGMSVLAVYAGFILRDKWRERRAKRDTTPADDPGWWLKG